MAINYGIRGPAFEHFIRSILYRGGLRPYHIDALVEPIYLYDRAFTHPSAHPEHNYEYFEFIGDSMVNNALVMYLHKRFPQLHTAFGVKVMSRLKILLVSRKTFEGIASGEGIWNFVTATMLEKKNNRKTILEDVFEALFGAIHVACELKLGPNMSFPIIANIIGNMYDKLPISLAYEDLFDAKTRLKELFQYHKNIGTWTVESEIIDDSKMQSVKIVQRNNHAQTRVIGQALAYKKKDGEQIACEHALEFLKREGIVRPIAQEYLQLSQM